jgi:hypothetical protein
MRSREINAAGRKPCNLGGCTLVGKFRCLRNAIECYPGASHTVRRTVPLICIGLLVFQSENRERSAMSRMSSPFPGGTNQPRKILSARPGTLL